MADMPTFSSDDYEPPPAVPFKLTGRTLTAQEPWEEVFSILGAAPQGAVVDLASSVSIKNGNIEYNAASVVRFLRAVLVPIDEQRFDALIHDKDRVVPVEQLGAVMLWAAGQVAERPTGPLPSSTPGQRATPAGSEADSPSVDAAEAGSIT